MTKVYERGKIKYQYPEGKTKNQKDSDDIEATVQALLDKGFEEIPTTKASIKKIPLYSYISYVSNIKGKPLFRRGGVINSIQKDGDYFTLYNLVSRVHFSVQQKNLERLFYKMTKTQMKKLNKPTGKLLDIQEKKKKKKKDEFDYKPILKKLYYEDGNVVSRDALYDLARQEDKRIKRRQVEKWLNNQMLHQLTKKRPKQTAVSSFVPSKPFSIYALDLIDMQKYSAHNDGYNWILNIMDVFTKYLWSIPLEDKTLSTIIKEMKKLFRKPNWRKPTVMLSDNEFNKEEYIDFMKDSDIKPLFTIAGNPQSNGAIERLNRTLKEQIRKDFAIKNNLNDQWHSQLPRLVRAYNKRKHNTIGMSPIQAMKPENLEIVKSRIEDKKLSNNFDGNDKDLNVGDKVRVLLEKNKFKGNLFNWSREVFTIRQKTKPRNPKQRIKYKVMASDGEPLTGFFNGSQLQKINTVEHEDKVNDQIDQLSEEPEIDDVDGVEVEPNHPEKFLDKGIRREGSRRLVEYLVKWDGFTNRFNKWVTREELENKYDKQTVRELAKEYNEQNK